MSRALPSVTSSNVGACIVDTESLYQLSRKRHLAPFETLRYQDNHRGLADETRGIQQTHTLTDQKLEARQHLRYCWGRPEVHGHSLQTIALILPQPCPSPLDSGHELAALNLSDPFFETVDTAHLLNFLWQQIPEVHYLLCEKALNNFKQILFQLVPLSSSIKDLHLPYLPPSWLQLKSALSLLSVFSCLNWSHSLFSSYSRNHILLIISVSFSGPSLALPHNFWGAETRTLHSPRGVGAPRSPQFC